MLGQLQWVSTRLADEAIMTLVLAPLADLQLQHAITIVTYSNRRMVQPAKLCKTYDAACRSTPLPTCSAYVLSSLTIQSGFMTSTT